MRTMNKMMATLSGAALVASGAVALTAAPALAVGPTGGCSSFFTSGQALEDTTPAASYLGQPNGAWSDEATTGAPGFGIDPDYTLTTSGASAVGGTRTFELTYDKGMRSFATATGTAHWYFKVNGTALPAVTQARTAPGGATEAGATITGSFPITQGGTNTIVFHKMIFETTSGVRVVCSGQEGNTATVNPHSVPVDTNVTASFSAFAVANATINSISDQNVTTHARSGDVISFTGSGFSAAGAGTAELCDTDGSNCNAASSAFTVAGGSGTGTLTVPAGVTGAKALRLSSGGEVGLRPVTILGQPTLAANISAGGAGTTVTLTGTNWDPSKSVSVGGFAAGPPFPPPATADAPVTATSGANGSLSTSFTVNAANTVNLGASQRPGPGAIFSSVPFTFSGDSCTAKEGLELTGDCSVLETVTLTVVAGDLKMSKDAGSVEMSGVELNGAPQTSTGTLQDALVMDYRGGTLGWSLTASFSGLNGPVAIAPDKMTLTPACAADATNNDDTVVVGSSAAFVDAATALPLCAVTTGLGADAVSGGDTAADADLSLDLVANQAAGDYTGTITLTLS